MRDGLRTLGVVLRLEGRTRLLVLVVVGMLTVSAATAGLTLAADDPAPPEESAEVGDTPSGEPEAPPEPEEDSSEEDSSEGDPGDAGEEDQPPEEGEPSPDEGAVEAPAEDRPADLPEGAEAVPGEIIVRFRRGADAEERQAARDDVEAEVEESLPLPGVQLLSVDSDAVGDELEALEDDPAVEYAEPNLVRHVEQTQTRTPNDPRFSDEYGLNNEAQDFGRGTPGTFDADIDAPEAWADTVGSRDVKVAVVDTGIDGSHPDLKPNLDVSAGRDFFAEGDSDPSDENGHGTHVAGTIGADGDNGAGVTGVNWDTRLIAVRAFGPDGSGSTADLVEAYAYADSVGADVLNASFGGSGFSRTERDAIAAAGDVLFVAAAGNEKTDNDTTPSYPCNYDLPNVVCVAASDENDQLASFSNYGNSVDLAAPGVDILSTLRGGGYGYLSGTSMATPHVAGVAALVAAKRSGSSPANLRDDLLDGVDFKPNLTSVGSSGRVNADRSVAGEGDDTSPGTGAEPPPPLSPTPAPTPQPSPDTGSGGSGSGSGSGSDDGGSGGGGGGSGGGGGGSSGGGGGGGGGSDPGVVPVLPPPAATPPAPPVRRPSRCDRLRGVRRARCVRRARALARCRKLAPSKRRACVVRVRRASGR